MAGARARRALAVVALTVVGAYAQPAAADEERALIVLYDGYGTTGRARLWGRVLEDKGVVSTRSPKSLWRRVRRTFSVFESDEIPYARVELSVAGKTARVKADEEGLFRLELTGELPPGEHSVTAKLLSKRTFRVAGGKLRVYRPARRKRRIAVISDIDDTVLDSRVGSKLRLLWRTLSGSARRMHSFAGAPKLFRAFAARRYPIVFVSGSPINLYRRLKRFFELRGFPPGALRLKNFGTAPGSDALFGQRRYKLARIEETLNLLAGYRVILIGDSGERDPEIYRTIARRHPARVAAVLIRRAGSASAGDRRFAGQLLFSRYARAARYLRRRKLL